MRSSPPPTPGSDCLRQSVIRSQLLRAPELFKGGAASLRGNCEGKWKGTQGEPDSLVGIHVALLVVRSRVFDGSSPKAFHIRPRSDPIG